MDNYDSYIGTFLDNRYEILEKIGTGGMAVVYKARCHRLNRLVAVKILKSDLAQDAELRRRFHAESQAVAMLSHPNIVSVYDVSRAGNVEYIVMELIEGITLKQYINRKGVLNWKETLHFTTQIVKALQHAHSRGIIHRDIKPHNIMILRDGSVKVADFGIAQLLNTQNTLTQNALGSVHYISPEQAKGSQVDVRSDLYSVGVVMYEMLTNRLPFEGDSAVSVAIQHISSVPLQPRELNPSIPVGLAQITMHAMEPVLERRYPSAEAMLYDLEEFRKNPDIVFQSASAIPNRPVSVDTATRVIPPVSNAGAVVKTVEDAAKKANNRRPKELTDKEYNAVKRRSGQTSILIGIALLIGFLILAFTFMWNFILKDMLDPDENRVAIPSFVGNDYDEVAADSEYASYFNFVPTYVYSDVYSEGYIMEQNPAANRQMSVSGEKIDIELTVSNGSEAVLMPDVLNRDYREAELLLKNYNLKLVVRTEAVYDDDVTEGYVMEQYPAKGTQLTEGMEIYLTYSKGPEVVYVEVPLVVGYTESQAISKLMGMDLAYDVQYVDSDMEKGRVIYQSRLAGEKVAVHTKVVIQVSKGPVQEEIPEGDIVQTP